MKNQDFELQCKQILEVKHNEVTKFIGTILNKEGKELDKSISQHAVLAHILPELLTYGCVVRTSTSEIAEACKCKSTVVNNVLGFAGFKYERDRLTHKAGYESKGLFERYYQYEYTDNGKTKKTSSVFNIVATQKLFDLFAEELGLEIKIDKDALAKLHSDSKDKAYTKSVKRETVVITLTRETTVFSNAEGTTNTVQYSGIKSAMEQLQEFQAEQQEAVIESEEDVEALLAQAEEEDDFDFDFLTIDEEPETDLEIEFEEEFVAVEEEVEESTEPQPEVEEAQVTYHNNQVKRVNGRKLTSRKQGSLDGYGNARKARNLGTENNEDLVKALKWKEKIESGEWNERNLKPDQIVRIYTTWQELNNGFAPTSIEKLYTEVILGFEY